MRSAPSAFVIRRRFDRAQHGGGLRRPRRGRPAERRAQGRDRAARDARRKPRAMKIGKHPAATTSPARPMRRRPPTRTARATRRPIRPPAAPAPKSRARTRRRRDTAVLVNGAWNVADAPADSQTIPAKFSKRNDAIDHVPVMAMAVLAFSNDQKRSIIDAVHGANPPVQMTSAKPVRGTADRHHGAGLAGGGQRSGVRQDEICAGAGPHPAGRADQPHRDRRDSELGCGRLDGPQTRQQGKTVGAGDRLAVGCRQFLRVA